jgi:hypothetical protein
MSGKFDKKNIATVFPLAAAHLARYVGAVAIGAGAVGALAIGSAAIGKIAIGMISAHKVRLEDVDIGTLTVRKLIVLEASEDK